MRLKSLTRGGFEAGARQRGMTAIGILCVLALVGIIGFAGLKLTPIYLNYMKVARALDATAQESKGDNPDPVTLRRTLEKHWQIDDITGIEPKDVEINKNEDGVSLHAVYDDSTTFLANVSLVAHFDKTVKVP